MRSGPTTKAVIFEQSQTSCRRGRDDADPALPLGACPVDGPRPRRSICRRSTRPGPGGIAGPQECASRSRAIRTRSGHDRHERLDEAVQRRETDASGDDDCMPAVRVLDRPEGAERTSNADLRARVKVHDAVEVGPTVRIVSRSHWRGTARSRLDSREGGQGDHHELNRSTG